MGHTLPSRGTLLLDKVKKLSQTAIRRDSDTNMETFVDLSDIFYLKFSFHMKHMRYFSPTMNNDNDNDNDKVFYLSIIFQKNVK